MQKSGQAMDTPTGRLGGLFFHPFRYFIGYVPLHLAGPGPEHPEINEKSRFSADRKSSKTSLCGCQTQLSSPESAQAWPETPPILFLGPEDEIPESSRG